MVPPEMVSKLGCEMRASIFPEIIVCAVLGGLLSAATPPAVTAEKPINCNFDRAAMLNLDFDTFDQDDSKGWRKIGNRPECRRAAADLIDQYIKAHRAELARQWRIPSLRWHEAQLRAFARDRLKAIALMKQSLKPLTGPKEFVGWTEFAAAWNAYVNASIAFLGRDLNELKRGRTLLAGLQPPKGFLEENGPTEWPPNLDVVDALVACFDRSYEEAYGSDHCRKAAQELR
jgi:hypothetical protein